MTLTITIPESMTLQLQRKAEQEHQSPETVALAILQDALDWGDFPTLEEVVAKAQKLPRDTRNLRPAKGSLADALRNLPPDPTFDLTEWEREWAKVEAMIKANDSIG